MEVPTGFLVVSLLLSCFALTSYGVTFSSLKETLVVTATSGTYFVRAYVLNAQGVEVGFGQNTNAQKSTNLFEIEAITGRHVSLDIASVCFSAFSIVALGGFFYMEKSKAKASQDK